MPRHTWTPAASLALILRLWLERRTAVAEGGSRSDSKKPELLSAAELAEQQSSELPERDAMSLVNLNAAIPVNAAIAANVLSDGSTASAAALQHTPITQAT